MSELEEVLQFRVIKLRESYAQRQKERYDLAKSLGFTPIEASVLMNWKKSKIKDLAEERKEGKVVE